MPITVLADMILPNSVISSGVRGKIKRTNTRTPHGETGYMTVNAVSSQALREFELGTVPMRLEDWQRVQAFHEITLGGAYGFLIEDPADCVTATGAIVLMPAIGSAPAYYQLVRRYIDPKSGRYSDRPITRPQLSTFQLLNSNGTAYTSTYTLDTTTGRITASADPTTLTWSGRFHTPVHFQADDLDWDLIAPGGYDQRFVAGPSVILEEVRE
jgi:uncharacterized protein (TIGR02217 family)